MRRDFSGFRFLVLWGLIAATLGVEAASAESLRNFARLRGQGQSVIQGLGLVVGLNGTGDSGRELSVARPLAEMLRRNGNPVADLAELRNARAVALVMVTCVIPRTGARVDDTFNVRVNVLNSASSLTGGELYVTPMTAPLPGSQVYAFAQGQLVIEDPELPTTATVYDGARMVRDIATTPRLGEAFDVVLDSVYAGYTAASAMSRTINDAYFLTTDPLADPIAFVLDERTVRVRIPDVERANPAAFVSDVMGTELTSTQLGLPAMVVANSRTGAIVVTGDVRISPAIITHKELVITTTIPAPEPTPQQPIVQRSRWAPVQTSADSVEQTRVEDLLAAFRRLDVPPADQIQILKMLQRAGKLHGKLVIDGAEA